MSYLLKVVIFTLLFVQAANAEKIYIGITSVPLNLNPLYATDANSQNINRLTHQSLIDFDTLMNKQCIACLNFKEEFISGVHQARFDLKKEIKFWDGTDVSSQDVYNSWKYFTNKNNKSSHIRAFENIKDIKILNQHSLIIYFSKFSIENISNLALLKILKIKNKHDYVGCGKYKADKISPLEVELVPAFNKKKPKLIFKVVKDETTLALKLMNEEVDISLGGISPRKNNWLRKNVKGKVFLEIPGTNYKYISFNHKNVHLQNKLVREAIASLIPRRDLLKYKLFGTAVLSKGLFSPSFGAYFNDSQKYEWNKEKARKLLSKAGYQKINGSWRKDKKQLVLDWKVSNNKATIEIVKILKDELGKEGIKINLSVQEWGTFMKNVKKGRFDIIMGQWIGFTGPDMMKFIWHSESFPPKGANRGFYSNQKFDSLINDATTERNEAKRNSTYKKAQRLAENDYAYLGMWHPNITWIAKKCIKGIELYPNGGFLGLRDIRSECGNE